MQKLRIPVTQVLGLDPGKFQSSQSRLEFVGSKTKTNLYTGGHD